MRASAHNLAVIGIRVWQRIRTIDGHYLLFRFVLNLVLLLLNNIDITYINRIY